MDFNITFLGTSSAVPTAKRNHPAIFIGVNSENILIDCGEGTQRQFRKAKLNPCKLTKLLITHWHADHILGIPGLLETLSMSEYSKTLEIYGPRGTKEKIAAMEKLFGKFRIKYKINEISGKFIDTNELTFYASTMSHGILTNAYSITIKDKRRLDKSKIKKLKLPNSPLLKKLQQGKDVALNGKKIKSSSVSYIEKGKKLTIVLDTSFNKKAITFAKDSDLLITESSFLESSKDGLKKSKEYKHLTAKQAATIAKKAKVKQLIITHYSQKYSLTPEILLKEAKKVFKKTSTVEDLDQITI